MAHVSAYAGILGGDLELRLAVRGGSRRTAIARHAAGGLIVGGHFGGRSTVV
ncbi:hypothetical protein [Blastococcus mobilis]|uniref:Uncharacterized protein n=1 Tax=Blastococcus mobilis TaxID=1938746 RepID=A0A238Z3W7_9ACTN|nr:hypothetical protein [Blastococcus mobilis]SNR77554.1 hypothetical protein SAMN06272737_12458 [Blastococcus mobilis]